METFVRRYLIAGAEELPNVLEASFASDRDESHGQLTGAVTEDAEGPGTAEAKSNPRSLKSMVQTLRCQTERNESQRLWKTGPKAAARLLGVSYRTILYKIDQYEMIAPDSCLSSLPGDCHS